MGLHSQGAALDATESKGWQPIHYAAWRGHLDVARWLHEQGVALEDKVCIYGGSYGGYACLAGLTFTPDLYACGVDIVGPSNIKTLLDSMFNFDKVRMRAAPAVHSMPHAPARDSFAHAL